MSDGNLPSNPVCVSGEIYVGRVVDNGANIVGKIHIRLNKIYYGYESSERTSTSYEALEYPTGETLAWKAHQAGQTIPDNAIIGGYTSGKSGTCHLSLHN